MVKLVSLSERAYMLLKSFKKKDESFSDIVIDLVEQKKGNVNEVLKFAGTWNMSKEESDRITKAIYEGREKSRTREFKL